jgi:hypothetical protein
MVFGELEAICGAAVHTLMGIAFVADVFSYVEVNLFINIIFIDG